MADLERDLERLLAGDQNVGLPLVDGGASSSRGPIKTAQRWPLGLAAALVLGAGVTVALWRPSHPQPEHTVASPPVSAPASAPPAAAPPTAAPPSPPPDEHVAERPARPAPRGKARAERRPAAAETQQRPAATTDSVKRGVLPLGSREAYPDQ
jgi:hypothetical protein